jgi:DNA primase
MAGRIPQSFINELLSRIDIVDVIDARLKLRKQGRNHVALCPFHDEKTASFSVNAEKQFYHCFGCGASGTALTFLLEHDRLDFVAAVETLAAQAGMTVPREAGAARADDADRASYALMEEAATWFRQCLRTHPDAPRAVDYLKGRGLTGVTVRDFGIGFAPPGWDGLRDALGPERTADLVKLGLLVESDRGGYDRFRDRIMFPIRDSRGRTIAFGGRVLGDEQPKYLNSPETPLFHKGRELYGLYEARRAVRQLERLIVVEGYMDVVALAQAGVPNAVATLGTASNAEHFDRLFRLVSEVVCCFDGDRAGREAAWKALTVALPSLKEGRQLKFMFLPDGEDPDSLVRAQGRAAFETQAGKALSAGEFLFQRLSTGLDLDSLDGRARLGELALPHIEQVAPGVLRELLIGRLADLTGVPLAALQRRLGAVRPRGGPVRPGGPVRHGEGPQADFSSAPMADHVAGPASAAPRPAPRASNRAAPQAAPRLSDDLLAMIVQFPEFLHALDDHRRARLLGMEDSLLARVVRFVCEDEEHDTSALLGYWTGAPEHATLVRCADRRFLLDKDALKVEFSDAVDQYLQAVSKAYRKVLVRDMRETADETQSKDTLERWWQGLIRAGTDTSNR